MSKVLASLCNMPQPASSGLVLVDFDTGECRLLDMGLPEKIKTCTGLALAGGRVYAIGVTVAGVHYLAALASDTFDRVFVCRLDDVKDAHSILAVHDALYVVSTGTDAVLRYDLSPGGVSNPVVAWQASDEGRDTHHINAIALWNEDVVISAFGPKIGATWSTATGGYIHSLTHNRRVAEGIYQPHSLCAANGELYYCESARGRLYSVGGDCLEVGGYLRGLAFASSRQFVAGTSVARKISKSSGIINNPGDPGEPSGKCALVVCALGAEGAKGAKRLTEISLAAYGAEIYDVVVPDWTEMAASGDESSLPEIRSVPPRTEDHEELAEVQTLSELQYRMGTLIGEREPSGQQSGMKDEKIEPLPLSKRGAPLRRLVEWLRKWLNT